MQADVTDGALAVVQSGIADPDRMCIAGGSYGGYAALAGATFTPELYRCAIAFAAVADVPQFLSDMGDRFGRSGSTYRYWSRSIGGSLDEHASGADLRAVSPVHHAERITIPVLLLHGRDDSVVPADQTDRMYDAMRSSRSDVERIWLDGGDHWLTDAETRRHVLEAMGEFLDSQIGPGSQ